MSLTSGLPASHWLPGAGLSLAHTGCCGGAGRRGPDRPGFMVAAEDLAYKMFIIYRGLALCHMTTRSHTHPAGQINTQSHEYLISVDCYPPEGFH